MSSLQVDTLNFNKKISINFEGGDLSSDTGLLAYRAFDEKIGLTKLVQESFENDSVSEKHLTYKRADVVLQNIYKFTAGYHTDDASDELAIDPIFRVLLKMDKLPSQPTVSRRNNELDKNTFRLLQNINQEILDRSYRIEAPKHVIFDIDSTETQTHGKQHGSSYNHHYGSTGFHPLLAFDGVTGDLIKAELRSGNVYTSRNVTKFMGPVLSHYKMKHKNTYMVIRADSGFAMPELYKLAEQHGVAYAIRLKANATLSKLSNELLLDFQDIHGSDFSKTNTLYGQFMYQAKSWDKARRVVCKIERKAGELLPSHTFVVTSMDASAKDVIRFYSKRGTMENFIKEAKLDFGMDSLSHTAYMANANRLMQMALAYNLNNLMRRLCFTQENKPKRMHTLRTMLTKVAGRFVTSGRYSVFKLCSSYPYKRFFVDLFNRIDLLPSFG